MGTQEPEFHVALPDHVVSKVEARLQRTDFDTVEEYVTFVMEETLARVEAQTDTEATTVDEEEVRTRLESLGYLEE